MKIVILNDSFFSEEHLAALRALGDLQIYDGTTTTEQAIERTGDADIVLGDGFVIDFNKTYFAAVPNLKLLALNTTAFAIVDLEAARANGTQVANCPGYSTRSVAELVIGLMFALVRRIPYGDKRYRQGFTDQEPNSSQGKEFISYDLAGKTLGIVGVGRIGSEIARMGKGLDMNVIGWNRTPREEVQLVELETLMKTSDVVVMSLLYSEETKGILSRDMLQLMKPNAVLINIAKRDCVDMQTLYELLAEHKIHGAGFDWAQCEPHDPLLQLDNVVFTPHIAVYTTETLYGNLPGMIVRNVESFVKGSPEHIVTG